MIMTAKLVVQKTIVKVLKMVKNTNAWFKNKLILKTRLAAQGE